MEADLPINHRVTISGAELSMSVSRASGPGGQHVNKTSSRVSLRFNIAESKAFTDEEKARLLLKLRHRLVGGSEILLHVESERSQLQNRRLARERLAKLIKDALTTRKSRVATKPTAGSKVRRIESKKLRGIVKKLRRSIND